MNELALLHLLIKGLEIEVEKKRLPCIVLSLSGHSLTDKSSAFYISMR